jgi:uncharacterized DUF497 family protein
MRILPNPIMFQWDQGNTDNNLIKHRVTIQEAEELFSSQPFLVADDHRHTTEIELRYQALGTTKIGRKLFVAFTVRDKKIRIISIRDMKKKERLAYERLQANS